MKLTNTFPRDCFPSSYLAKEICNRARIMRKCLGLDVCTLGLFLGQILSRFVKERGNRIVEDLSQTVSSPFISRS